MRIVALSDTHGYLPAIPACDLFLHAGDICVDRVPPGVLAQRVPEAQLEWFKRIVLPWLHAVPASHKILTWGNHDRRGQCCSVRSSDQLHVLVDAEITIHVGNQPLRIWATPSSNKFLDWAFMQAPDALASIYAAIPIGIDILVSHQPPVGHGDTVGRRGKHLGSRELLDTIRRVQPKLVVCGHIHGGFRRMTSIIVDPVL